jgi:hypothetical protein
MDLSSFLEKAGKMGAISGILIFSGLFVGLPMSGTIFNEWRTAAFASRYTKETLVIESVRMAKMRIKGAKNTPVATGTVNGHPEEISLQGFEVEVESLAGLEAQFPPGTELEILYDPTASPIFINGTTLRAISPSSGGGSWGKAIGLTMIPGTPFLAGGIGLLICYLRQREQGGKVKSD